ncbi:MAG: ferrous iron transport protein A [Cytophagales bacterium]|nr:MAG: ferrous iron transport protein A [Cytophagales bacterium]
MTLKDLKIGEKAVIKELKTGFNMKLLEMGCVPGNSIKVLHIGFRGSPIAIQLLDYTLAIRADDAYFIEIEV